MSLCICFLGARRDFGIRESLCCVWQWGAVSRGRAWRRFSRGCHLNRLLNYCSHRSWHAQTGINGKSLYWRNPVYLHLWAVHWSVFSLFLDVKLEASYFLVLFWRVNFHFEQYFSECFCRESASTLSEYLPSGDFQTLPYPHLTRASGLEFRNLHFKRNSLNDF